MTTPSPPAPIRVGISSCLLGEEVRFDGGHKRDPFVTDLLGLHFEYVPVCPEVESGMGIPREPVRLVGRHDRPRMVGVKSARDFTAGMERFAKARVRALGALDLSGYILKSRSPSCGMERVTVYAPSGGRAAKSGRGLYARALMEAWPDLPVEEEGRLNDPRLRENFIERVFCYRRWREFLAAGPTRGALVAFHTAHKFLLLAHAPELYRRLGRIVAGNGQRVPAARLAAAYAPIFFEALSHKGTTRRHTNVLQHMAGFASPHLSADERKELAEVIEDYHRELVPLIVPLTLLRHHVRRHGISYLADQIYLNPHPKELMLRNHV